MPSQAENVSLHETVEEAVHRIVTAIHPERIVLFGSAARGDTHPGSDIDLLVVVQDGMDRLATAQGLYHTMRGLPSATDIVVAWCSDIASYGDNPNLVFHTALTEGKEVYRAA